MANRIIAGAIAGAAGTLALNTATYLDMLVRGRGASDLPAKVASKIADETGVPLDFDVPEEGGEELVRNRETALGALLGYVNGVGLGIAYGVTRLVVPRPPAWLAGALLGSAAMAASDYPATRLGLTNPKQWSGSSWAADVVPHMVYGVVTALAFEHTKS